MPSVADNGAHAASHRWFYLPSPWPDPGAVVRLPEEEGHHAARVLRVTRGAEVVLVDGHGRQCRAVVEQVTGSQVDVRLGRLEAAHGERAQAGRLGLAWIRTSVRLEWAIEKAVELGVVGIDLFGAERSVGWRLARAEGKRDRWRRVAKAAMKQAGRALCPPVALHGDLTELLAAREGARLICADPGGEALTAATLAEAAPAETLLLVGPEGGWSDGERGRLHQAGAACVTLGPRRLRAETAAALLCGEAARVRASTHSQSG